MKKLAALPAVSIISLYLIAVGFNVYFKTESALRPRGEDIIERIFGGLRGYIGDWAFMKAEEYHHRGLPFLQAVAYHEGEGFFSGEEHHHDEGAAQIQKKDLFSKIYSSVKITQDSHLKPAEEKEALPWFYVEVAFNPNDIKGYVLGAYWLERMNRMDESLKFLKDGLKNNPASAAITAAIGSLDVKLGKVDEAKRYLERARRLWQEGAYPNNATDVYSVSDRFFALDMLGYLYEKAGDKASALEAYREAYSLKEDPNLLQKIKTLGGAGEPIRGQAL